MRRAHRACLASAGMIAVLAAVLAAGACLDTVSSANCPQFEDCVSCTMEPACSFCLETNACLADDQVCGGDRAQSPDMCEEGH